MHTNSTLRALRIEKFYDLVGKVGYVTFIGFVASFKYSVRNQKFKFDTNRYTSRLSKIHVSSSTIKSLNNAVCEIDVWEPNHHNVGFTFMGHRFYIDDTLALGIFSLEYTVRALGDPPAVHNFSHPASGIYGTSVALVDR